LDRSLDLPVSRAGVVFLNQDHAQFQFAPNAVKKIITNPSPNSPNAANSLHTTLYHCFPTIDQQSWIANQNAATAIAPNKIT
jgi:hypothetical protein